MSLTHGEKIEIKKRIREAFKDLNKEGFICKGNHLCCSSCAGYDLATKVTEKIKEDKNYAKQFKGVVFWHGQDEQGLMSDRGDGIFLAYGNVDTNDFGEVGADDFVVGTILKNTLIKHKLKVEWDGNPNTRIFVNGLE